jgi:hypothetical protein
MFCYVNIYLKRSTYDYEPATVPTAPDRGEKLTKSKKKFAKNISPILKGVSVMLATAMSL